MSGAEHKHTIIPACDCDAVTFQALVEKTHSLEGLSAYKVGFRLGLEIGLPEAVRIVRRHTQKPVMYDHQKAANDIPDTGKLFAEVCKRAGIDSVILFPLTGPLVLKGWVEACRQAELDVIVGGLMTHDRFLVSEGGFIADEAAQLIYMMAADLGVTDFVLPSTKMDFSWSIYQSLRNRGVNPTFYSPGIGTQGGKWSDLCRDDGPPWHAIVGRSILQGGDYRKNAEAFLKEVPQRRS